ncbi:MAG: AraC family transcriptional regulator [Alphaproteobacteria bacterium]|nr:AraC family transcriptional regulator [Alphaproteobacteria bacterium]
MPAFTIAATLARGFVEFAVARGADRASIETAAGVRLAADDDLDARIDLEAYRRLVRSAEAACNDRALSLRYGAQVDMAQVSIVGLIMVSAATMGEAFAQMQRYGRLAVELEGPVDQPRYTLAARDGQLWIVDNSVDAAGFPELSESALARLTCGPRRFLSQPHVLEAHFAWPRPAYADVYEDVFQCPLRFDAGWTALRMHPETASWPVAQQPRYAFGVLIEKADALLAALDAAKTVRGRVEALLLPRLHMGDCSIDAIAAAFGVSRQTLTRRLKREGATFETVLDDLRRQMAERYLAGRRTSVNETAYLVGFSEPAAFSRAYKRWTGHSPGKARRD